MQTKGLSIFWEGFSNAEHTFSGEGLSTASFSAEGGAQQPFSAVGVTLNNLSSAVGGAQKCSEYQQSLVQWEGLKSAVSGRECSAVFSAVGGAQTTLLVQWEGLSSL